jgi:DNA repair protein RecO (recombination protein O)
MHQPGYVLHTRPYRESSLLIDIFTRTYGRATLLAKGIRRLKSRQRSAMMPFSPLSMGWSGKGDLPVLTHSEQDGSVNMLSGRGRLCGFYANELLMKLLHKHDPHVALFDAYHELLEAIRAGGHIEISLRLFEKTLLRELGYALDLECEADGVTKVRPEIQYRYVPDFGVVRAGGTENIALTVSGASLLSLAREEFSNNKGIEECKFLMRNIIGHHLGAYKLRSRSLFGVFK